MRETFRNYRYPVDYQLIGDFLVEHYQAGNSDGNWLQPAWEYMHTHPYLDKSSLGKIGVCEYASKIVGVVNFESILGEGFFQIHPDYGYLKPAMLAYAERHLYAEKDGQMYLRVYVNDFDLDFQALVKSLGYEKDESCARPFSQFVIPGLFPAITLPPGFELKSLAEDNDYTKIHRVLWRGFNHPGEPPADGIEERRLMQLTPNFQKELKMVAVAPDGNFVSFCGMWYEPTNRIAYVEPVATDPDFRRMGLGKAAVLEGIRRCAVLGATVAYVGSVDIFYQALGFNKIYTSECWYKIFRSAGSGVYTR